MHKILQFIPIQLTFFLVLGIVFGYYFDVNLIYLLFILIGLLTILGLSYWQSKKSFSSNYHFNFVVYLLMFTIGISTITIHNDVNKKQHYSHFISDENKVVLIIEKVLKSDNYNDKYEALVVKVNDYSTVGKVLLNVQKDSLQKLQVDDKIYLKTDFKEVNLPKNPYFFNYRDYLKNKQIYHQIFTSNNSFLQLLKRPFSFKGLAAKFRRKINQKLIENGFKDDELAVMNALLLGQRQDISSELLQSYAGAGAIHILAVSGLHVGIILLILNFLFQPLERLKNGKLIKLIVVISLLWIFAFIAGMSASVVRAVTMFTAVAIGMQVNRPTNVYNTLVISMFFLLLFHPYFLFDVGFQLSYLAVFFIVWLQPLLYDFWHPKYKTPNFFWKLFTVSVAAQIGIVPLSLYYFHQFPSLFFISNLLIIPALGLILGLGILVIALALFNILPPFLSEGYILFINKMNWLVGWVSKQEDFLFKDIPFSLLMVLVSYILIVFAIRFFEKRNARRFILFLSAVLLFQGIFIYEKKIRQSTNEFIVFYKSKYSLIADRKGDKFTVFHSSDSLNLSEKNILKQYKIGVGNLKLKTIRANSNVYQFKNKKILVIDSLGVYQLKKIKPEIVLLQQSPKINISRLIDSLQPKLIIADGSNYKSYVKRWRSTCEQKNTPFYDVSQKGAYILK